jgi:hypothetical protein
VLKHFSTIIEREGKLLKERLQQGQQLKRLGYEISDEDLLQNAVADRFGKLHLASSDAFARLDRFVDDGSTSSGNIMLVTGLTGTGKVRVGRVGREKNREK